MIKPRKIVKINAFFIISNKNGVHTNRTIDVCITKNIHFMFITTDRLLLLNLAEGSDLVTAPRAQ